MSRSPLAIIVAVALGLVALGGCGSDDDATTSTTASQAAPTDDAARALSVCAPLATIAAIFTDMEEVATGSQAGRVSADASLATALTQIEEVTDDPSSEVADAIETLRKVRFADDPSPPEGGTVDPGGTDTESAVSTLTAQVGEPCGDLGG